MSLNELLQASQITWHGVKLNQPDWSHYSHSIAFTVQSLSGSLTMHFMLNAFHNSLEFDLPALPEGPGWKRWIDTAVESPGDICPWQHAPKINKNKYVVAPYCSVILMAT